MAAAAQDDAADGADVVVVASPGDSDVTGGGKKGGCGIDIDPADARAKEGHPGVRGISADEAGLIGRRIGFQVSADIAGGQPERAEAGDLELGEVLANAAAILEYFL